MTHADLALVLTWRNSTEVRRYMYTQHIISAQEHLNWFERCVNDNRNSLLIFEISDQPMGFVSFKVLGSGGIADWGFYAAPDAPKGLGRLLGTTALTHAFDHLALHKICGEALATNERSIRLHHSLGFKQEGVLSDQHFDGERYHSIISFSILAHEWNLYDQNIEPTS